MTDYSIQAGIVESGLCETLTALSHTLSRITQTCQSPSEMSRDTSQLHLLNMQVRCVTPSVRYSIESVITMFFTVVWLFNHLTSQCLSAQLASISNMISGMHTDVTISAVTDATSCLERISSCISSNQRALSSQMELLSRQLGHTPQRQVCPSQSSTVFYSRCFTVSNLFSMSFRLQSSCLKVQYLFLRPKKCSIGNQPASFKISQAYRYIVILLPNSVRKKTFYRGHYFLWH